MASNLVLLNFFRNSAQLFLFSSISSCPDIEQIEKEKGKLYSSTQLKHPYRDPRGTYRSISMYNETRTINL